MVNLELYRVFYAVAKCGSLTKAAEELHVSHSAVSQSVKGLEEQLGVQLFVRERRGMRLTAEGRELVLGDVEKALSLFDGVEYKLGELKNSASGTLRIGASETIFQYLLSEKIVAYSKAYPQVKIELISEVSPKILELLKNGGCDVGFLNLPLAPDPCVKIIDSIAYLHDVFIAGNAFAALKDKELTVRDLLDYPLLVMEEHTVAREAFERYSKAHGADLKPSVELNDWGFMKQLTADGMGIGCIPREYALNKINGGVLFELNVQPQMPCRSVGIALPEKVNMTFALRAFLNLLKKDKSHVEF